MECKYHFEREHLHADEKIYIMFHISNKQQPADLLTEDLGVLLMNKVKTAIIGM